MSRKKVIPSWEKEYADRGVHAPLGVKELRKNLKDGLRRRYIGYAENMFRYNFPDPVFDDMKLMSRENVPEKWLVQGGQCAAVEDNGQIHILLMVLQEGLNIYGYQNEWRVIPAGYESIPDQPTGNPVFDRLMFTPRSYDNSVIIRNDCFGSSDLAFIDSMVDELVDNMLTLNQLQLLAKAPFVFRCPANSSALKDAKNFYLALSLDYPTIFTDEGVDISDLIVQTGVQVDTGLLDLFRHWENILLEQLGIPGSVQNTKRAQQSVEEVTMADDKTTLRRQEKFLERK